MSMPQKPEIGFLLNPALDESWLPQYQTPGASGFDFKAFIPMAPNFISIGPGKICSIETGLSVEMPDGYEMQIRSRSGLAFKEGLFVLNQPGTVDMDYRGPIRILLANFMTWSYSVKHGDRIAQGVVCPVVQADIKAVQSIRMDTQRGAGGYGSTGI